MCGDWGTKPEHGSPQEDRTEDPRENPEGLYSDAVAAQPSQHSQPEPSLPAMLEARLLPLSLTPGEQDRVCMVTPSRRSQYARELRIGLRAVPPIGSSVFRQPAFPSFNRSNSRVVRAGSAKATEVAVGKPLQDDDGGPGTRAVLERADLGVAECE